jgi:hypothetical protein
MEGLKRIQRIRREKWKTKMEKMKNQRKEWERRKDG